MDQVLCQVLSPLILTYERQYFYLLFRDQKTETQGGHTAVTERLTQTY